MITWRTKAKRKSCPFSSGRVPVESIDYKNYKMLKKFTTDNYKIVPSRVTGVETHYQHMIAKAIKIARFLALIPYCDNH